MKEKEKRIFGMLAGCALGDAMGMPSEGMDARTIRKEFGIIRGFLPSSDKDVLKRSFHAGQITDDTVNTLLVCDTLIAGQGTFDPHIYLSLLKAWIRENPERSAFMIGPSTKRALSLIEKGMPIEEAGKNGTTNGSAMKAMPIGILSDDPDELIENVRLLCLATHSTNIAMAGACIVAALCAYALRKGNDIDTMWTIAQEISERFGQEELTERFVILKNCIAACSEEDVLDTLRAWGTGIETIETIPAVLALLSLSGLDPYSCALMAANLGGDTDTIGAISCSICGAVHPKIDEALVGTLESVNDLDLDGYAEKLASFLK